MIIGFILDHILGDPMNWPHIVRGYGALISFLDKKLYAIKNKKVGGALLVILVLLSVVLVVGGIEVLCFFIHPLLWVVVDGILCWQCLALKSLRVETLKVYQPLVEHDLNGARYAVSMVVGRDTENLDETGVTKACVETVAENTSDGVGAPLFYMGIGAGFLAAVYKAINTMDSMVGYKNERYLLFGRTAAKLDDIANYIPARLTALSMVIASYLLGYDGANAWKIFKRDRYKHASPNSAQTESVMAGALDVQLAGDAWYFGELHKKEYIGDPIREIEVEDIRKSHKLMQVSSYILFLCMILWEELWVLIFMAVR